MYKPNGGARLDLLTTYCGHLHDGGRVERASCTAQGMREVADTKKHEVRDQE